jgi:cytochrome c oxidase assembly factor CtaG
VLGVLAVLLPLLGVVLGIGAVVLARRARRLGTTHESRRVVGLVLGVVAVVIGVVGAFGLLATFSFSTDSGTEVGQTTGAALLVGPVAAR